MESNLINFIITLIMQKKQELKMEFKELRKIIKEASGNFQQSSLLLQQKIFSLTKKDIIPLVEEIGSIPEDIEHDSSEEKLYAKVSDILLAKCFMELGLKAEVIKERANCADVVVKSYFHGYSLVADAKSFRLSRTAKNQKDFKVESMVHWKGDNDFSVLCCPYFQYPKQKSQIYGQALNGNVSLFSWEYFCILLKKEIKETEKNNLSILWNISNIISEKTTVHNKNTCFLNQQNHFIQKVAGLSDKEFENLVFSFKENIIKRGNEEIDFWKKRIEEIKHYSRDRAIDMLIKSLKLNEKISAIQDYLNQIKG